MFYWYSRDWRSELGVGTEGVGGRDREERGRGHCGSDVTLKTVFSKKAGEKARSS